MDQLTINTYFNKIKNMYKITNLIKNKFKNKTPIILCLGNKNFNSDLLGPLVGELLKKKYNVKTYVYGSLSYPITYSNYEYVLNFLDLFHKGQPILVVDACLGEKEELGIVKVIRGGIRPGTGANKALNKVGDLSIVGITADKSFTFKQLMFKTKFEIIYKMADFIAYSISKAFKYTNEKINISPLLYNNYQIYNYF